MKRWPWYDQVRDAIFAFAALFLLFFEAIFRQNSDIYIVMAALILSGAAGSGIFSRWLIGRWTEEEKSK